ncbi:MAG: hypothetical protein E6Q97_17740 [Desulfurellales bacterium]|nr:MAG: hypothetical protein E6Q97_17740 [Desulfurellales bacterium]
MKPFVDALIQEMGANGFALTETINDPVLDGMGWRFRPAQHDALTMRLPAITITLSALEMMTDRATPVLARTKAADALRTYYAT